MNNHLQTLSALFFASTLTLSAGTAPHFATTRSVDLIDPAAFGFGRPGFMVDTTLIGTQDLANRPGGQEAEFGGAGKFRWGLAPVGQSQLQPLPHGGDHRAGEDHRFSHQQAGG